MWQWTKHLTCTVAFPVWEHRGANTLSVGQGTCMAVPTSLHSFYWPWMAKSLASKCFRDTSCLKKEQIREVTKRRISNKKLCCNGWGCSSVGEGSLWVLKALSLTFGVRGKKRRMKGGRWERGKVHEREGGRLGGREEGRKRAGGRERGSFKLSLNSWFRIRSFKWRHQASVLIFLMW